MIPKPALPSQEIVVQDRNAADKGYEETAQQQSEASHVPKVVSMPRCMHAAWQCTPIAALLDPVRHWQTHL